MPKLVLVLVSVFGAGVCISTYLYSHTIRLFYNMFIQKAYQNNDKSWAESASRHPLGFYSLGAASRSGMEGATTGPYPDEGRRMSPGGEGVSSRSMS